MGWVAFGEVLAAATWDSQDVGEWPGVIEGLDGEEWWVDKGPVILSKEAFPLLGHVGIDAVCVGRVSVFIGDFHEADKEVFVGGLFVVVVGRVKEDSWVWYGPDFGCLGSEVVDVVCPKIGGESSCALSGDDDVCCSGYLVELFNWGELSHDYCVSSKVELLVFVGDGVLFISLVASTRAVLEVDDGPIPEDVELVVAEDAFVLGPSGGVWGGAAQCGRASLIAVLEGGVECTWAAATPSSSLEAKENLAGWAFMDVVGPRSAVEAEGLRVLDSDLFEVGHGEGERYK